MPLFARIADAVQSAVAEMWGSPAARAEQGRGAGGDQTVYIDQVAEQVVLGMLAEAHERGREFTVISEEAGEHNYGGGGDFVIVDPIDGSHNAKMGIPYFSLSLAAATGRTAGTVYEGAVRNLVTGDHFSAARGSGAWLGSRRLSIPAGEDHISIVQIEPPALVERLPLYIDLINAAEKVRMLGSAALNICYTASGAISVSVAPTLRSVDYAAGVLVLEEAGGAVADMDGASIGPLDMALDRRSSVVSAQSPALLERALALLDQRR